jgi:hypothetical protein
LAGLVVETEDSFRVAPENFLAEGEKQMLEKILKVPIVNGHFRNLNWRYLPYIRPM